jgi:hypothetical protein
MTAFYQTAFFHHPSFQTSVMGPKSIGLFDAFDLQLDPYVIRPPFQDIILYCEARFRRILPAIAEADPIDKLWMVRTMRKELVR